MFSFYKKTVAIFTVLITLFGSTSFALAKFDISQGFDEASGLEDTGDETGHSYMDISDSGAEWTIGYIIGIILSLLGIIFLILMLYGGFVWMKARGKEEDVEKAKKIIQNALIGLVIVLGAYIIANTIWERIDF